MLISMKLIRTEDKTGEYWAPHDAKGNYDPAAIHILDDLGFPPDTDGWEEPPEIRGWYDCETLGCIVFDATRKGHSVVFHKHE